MSKQLKILLIVIGAVFLLWLAIILPDRIAYIKSPDFGYDKKCTELEKELKRELKKYLGELNVSFSSESNTLTVSFYESGYNFNYAYRCKTMTEDYINSHSEFFVHELGSAVEVQSKTDPYYDYPREMYIYKRTVENGTLALDEMQYLTDAYAIDRAKPEEIDIKTLTVTDHGDFDSAYAVAEVSPYLEKISFENKYRQPDDEQIKRLRELVGEDSLIEIYEEKGD